MAGVNQTIERNQDATVYVGDLDPQVNESLLWELMLQAGPVTNVHIPRDKLTQQHSGYGFVEFHSEDDADYAIKIMQLIKLFGKPIRVNKASRDKKTLDVGANIFVGNLDPEVDSKLLFDSFSQFGVILATPKIVREEEGTKGCGFISYDSFDAADAAVESMNGQFLCGRQISVCYAIKKGTKGDRHGSEAERLLAANNPNLARNNQSRPMFSPFPMPMPPGAPPMPPGMPPPMPPGMPPMPPGMQMMPGYPPYPAY